MGAITIKLDSTTPLDPLHYFNELVSATRSFLDKAKDAYKKDNYKKFVELCDTFRNGDSPKYSVEEKTKCAKEDIQYQFEKANKERLHKAGNELEELVENVKAFKKLIGNEKHFFIATNSISLFWDWFSELINPSTSEKAKWMKEQMIFLDIIGFDKHNNPYTDNLTFHYIPSVLKRHNLSYGRARSLINTYQNSIDQKWQITMRKILNYLAEEVLNKEMDNNAIVSASKTAPKQTKFKKVLPYLQQGKPKRIVTDKKWFEDIADKTGVNKGTIKAYYYRQSKK